MWGPKRADRKAEAQAWLLSWEVLRPDSPCKMAQSGCGLELAVDSFALRFFKDMDFEQALEAGSWGLRVPELQMKRQLGVRASLVSFVLSMARMHGPGTG